MKNSILGSSERLRRGALAKRYYYSLQYDGLADWYSEGPLHKRKPKIVLPLFAEAVRDVQSFLWGGENFPKISVSPTRKAGEVNKRDVGPAVDPNESSELSSFINNLVETTELSYYLREACNEALITTSAAIVLYTQGGFLSAFVVDGKDCTPTWSKQNPRRLEKLEILYRHEREEPTAWGTVPFQKPEYWYRHVIDETSDIVYKEVPVKTGALQPEWIVDEEKSVKHDLGFCPAHWIRTFPESSDPIDGRPFIDPALYPLIDDVNRVLSQRSRAVSYSTDPQPIRKGVDLQYREQLEKNPGKMWDLPSEGDFKFAEIQGSGAEQASKHLDDLTARFREAIGIVKATTDISTSRVSGVVLERLYRPMIALVGHLRHDFGQRGYAAVVNLALRMIAVEVGQKGKDIWIPGVYDMAPKLIAAQRQGAWLDFPMTIKWPSFFQLSETDKMQAVVTARDAHAAGLVRAETASNFIAPIFGVKDVGVESQEAQQEIANAQLRSAALGKVSVSPMSATHVSPTKEIDEIFDEHKAEMERESRGEDGGEPAETPYDLPGTD